MTTALACLVILSACKRDEAKTPAVGDVAQTTKTGVITEASMHHVRIEAPDGTTYSFAVGDDNRIRYIVGVVQDASVNVVSVIWDGTVYNIAKGDATIVEGNIFLGSTVTVYHKGNIKEGVMATKIVVKEAPAQPVTAEANTMSGVIVDALIVNSVIAERN